MKTLANPEAKRIPGQCKFGYLPFLLVAAELIRPSCNGRSELVKMCMAERMSSKTHRPVTDMAPPLRICSDEFRDRYALWLVNHGTLKPPWRLRDKFGQVDDLSGRNVALSNVKPPLVPYASSLTRLMGIAATQTYRLALDLDAGRKLRPRGWA